MPRRLEPGRKLTVCFGMFSFSVKSFTNTADFKGLLEERGETLQAPSNSEEPQGKGTGDHHGGIWTGTHKSGISMAKAKEKLHIGKNQ